MHRSPYVGRIFADDYAPHMRLVISNHHADFPVISFIPSFIHSFILPGCTGPKQNLQTGNNDPSC